MMDSPIVRWQRTADVAQLYLLMGTGALWPSPDVPSVDVERCEHMLQEAAAHGVRPRPPDVLAELFMSSVEMPTFPGDDEPPLL